MPHTVYVLLNEAPPQIQRIHPNRTTASDRSARRRARRLDRIARQALAWKSKEPPFGGSRPLLRIINDPWNHRWQTHMFLVAMVDLPGGLRSFVVVSRTEEALQTSLCLFFAGRRPTQREVRWVLHRLDRVLRHLCRMARHPVGDAGRAFWYLVAPLAISGCRVGPCPTTSVHVRCRAPPSEKIPGHTVYEGKDNNKTKKVRESTLWNH